MAIFHLHYQTISRGKKRSATAAASYRSATRIADTRERRRNRPPPIRKGAEEAAAAYHSDPRFANTRKRRRERHHRREEAEAASEGSPRKGKVHDYRAKMGVLKTLIKLPEWAQNKFMDRSVLWNGAEDAESRCRAVVAREMDVALPHELSKIEQFACAEDMADWLIERYRCGVDIAFHQPSQKEGHDRRNFHAHIMFTSRELTPEGFGEKTRVLDAFKTRESELRAIRQAWQDIVNARLAKAGLDIRIDCRTLEEQGIDRIPQIHVGVNGTAMADRGIKPESRERYDSQGHLIDWQKIDNGQSRAELKDKIVNLNDRRELLGPMPLEVQIKNIQRYIDLLIGKYADLEALIPAHMLPVWVQALIEKYRLKARDLFESFVQAIKQAEERQEEKKREGIHARMKRMEKEIEELQRAKERRQALQRLYTRIEAFVVMRPPLVVSIERPPTRILSVEQFQLELVARAEMARARVPPQYRPRMAVKDVIWDTVDHRHDEGSLGHHFHTGPPATNGGLAEPPPPISQPFNVAAGLEPEQSCKTKVRIGFGPA